MSSNHELYEATLVQRYCEGSCTPEERACIEANPDLPARAAALHYEEAALRQLFADAAGLRSIADDWPSPEDLIAYVDGALADPRHRYVGQCSQRYSEIYNEIQLLRELGSNPLLFECPTHL